MKKKCLVMTAGLLLFFITILCLKKEQKCRPKIVSCIESMDTAYLTVLAERWEMSEKEKLRTEVLLLCRKIDCKRKKIRVYLTKGDLEKGKAAFVIEY